MNAKPRKNNDCLAESKPRRTADRQRIKKGKSYVDITAMIRSLQRAEGHSDCFRSGLDDCDQYLCAWRRYCLSNIKSGFTESGE